MRAITFVLGLVFASTGVAAAGDWITAPSYFTHDPQTGERTQQYSPIGPFYVQQRSDYLRSGFRHTRSSIQAGNSADHLHVVEQWGRPVQPYGEWRFPYRPYSVPYPLWGPPFIGAGWGAFPPLPLPFAGLPSHLPSDPGHAYPRGEGDLNPPAWVDGNYSDYRTPRLPDKQFFRPSPNSP